MSKAKSIQFEAIINRLIYEDPSTNFRIYATTVEDDVIENLNLKRSKYGNVVISGTLHQLGEGLLYTIEAEETQGKNGYSYKVSNITRNRPKNSEEMFLFLREVITPEQAIVLWKEYPDIVQRVIDNRLDDIDLSKTKGIKEARFEVIKRKIIENYGIAEFVIEFKGLLSMSMVHKLYESFASLQVLKMELKRDPYGCLTKLHGIGFKAADNIALELEKEGIVTFDYDLISSKERCLAACIYLLKENEVNGNTRMNIVELRNQVCKLAPACSDKFAEAMKSDLIYYNKDRMIVALKQTYETEKYICESLIDAVHISNRWYIETDKYKYIDGNELSKEQQQVNALLCDHQVVILAGFAGSGKTYSTQAVLNMCRDNNIPYLCLSTTGKAAKVLSEYIQEDAQTIHRGLGYPCPQHPSGWAYNEENKLPYKLVIIDEFSMADVFLFSRVIDAIDFEKTKLLLVGDPSQCSSVGAGNLLNDMIASNKIPKVILTNIFRYGEGGLMTIATDVRNGKRFRCNSNQKMTALGDNKDYVFIHSTDDDILKDLLTVYKKVTSPKWQLAKGIGIEDVQVLTAKNVGALGTVALNNELQKIANKNYGSSNNIKVGETVYYENDIVIQIKNNYKAQIYNEGFLDEEESNKEYLIANGETGIIKRIDKRNNMIIIDFGGIDIAYSPFDMQNVSLGYAITGHKSQGSGIKVPIIVEPKKHIFMDTSNLLYVMLTRTKLMCFHLGLPDTINMAIRKKENLIRNTFTTELLKTL